MCFPLTKNGFIVRLGPKFGVQKSSVVSADPILVFIFFRLILLGAPFRGTASIQGSFSNHSKLFVHHLQSELLAEPHYCTVAFFYLVHHFYHHPIIRFQN